MDEKLKAADTKILQIKNERSQGNIFILLHSINFHVDVVNIIANYDFIFADTTWKEQIWAAAVNRAFTDVELIVGDQFNATHRFILSARSPVFSVMFNSGMVEDETWQVHIVDVDSNIFRAFLKFLYVGTWSPLTSKKNFWPWPNGL